MHKIKIFIADDHEIVIAGIEAILSLHDKYSLVGTALDGKEALLKIIKTKPDIVILDINMPEISGTELCMKILKELPSLKVIFHTCETEEDTVIKSFEAGASGYIPKSFKTADLLEAIEAVEKGNKYLKGIVSEIMLDSYFKIRNSSETGFVSELSEREIEIIKLISQGYLNKQIADKLNISQRTVEGHKSNILKKMNMNSTMEVVIWAIKKGLIKI